MAYYALLVRILVKKFRRRLLLPFQVDSKREITLRNLMTYPDLRDTFIIGVNAVRTTLQVDRMYWKAKQIKGGIVGY